MHAFEILGDPVRRRIVEMLADGEHAAGQIGEVIQREFDISQPAVSAHLRVLRENGFASVRAAGARRLYAIEVEPLQQVDASGISISTRWASRSYAASERAASHRQRRTRRR